MFVFVLILYTARCSPSSLFGQKFSSCRYCRSTPERFGEEKPSPLPRPVFHLRNHELTQLGQQTNQSGYRPAGTVPPGLDLHGLMTLGMGEHHHLL